MVLYLILSAHREENYTIWVNTSDLDVVRNCAKHLIDGVYANMFELFELVTVRPDSLDRCKLSEFCENEGICRSGKPVYKYKEET